MWWKSKKKEAKSEKSSETTDDGKVSLKIDIEHGAWAQVGFAGMTIDCDLLSGKITCPEELFGVLRCDGTTTQIWRQLDTLAQYSERLGREDAACEICRLSSRIMEHVGNVIMLSQSLSNEARVLRRNKREAEAERLYIEALNVLKKPLQSDAEREFLPRIAALIHSNYATLLSESPESRQGEAREHAGIALSLLRPEDSTMRANCECILARK